MNTNNSRRAQGVSYNSSSELIVNELSESYSGEPLESSIAAEEPCSLEEGDADVLERGIIAQSPAFTYTYNNAAPLNYLASEIILLEENKSHNNTPNGTNGTEQQQTAETIMHYQFLGDVCPTSAEALDNAVVFHVFNNTADATDPPFLSLDGRSNFTNTNTDRILEDVVKQQPDDAQFNNRNSNLDSVITPQGNSNNHNAATPTFHHLNRLVKRKPSLSGDDSPLLSPSPADGHDSTTITQILSAIEEYLSESASDEKRDNTVIPILPTIPASLLAFRTIVKRPTSSSSLHQQQSSIPDLYPICELKPTVEFPSSPSSNNNNHDNSQQYFMYIPDAVYSTPSETISTASTTDTSSTTKTTATKDTKPKQQRSLSRQFKSSDRLLQEAVQYSEALGEKPPRSVGEISREIIDTEDDDNIIFYDYNDDENNNHNTEDDLILSDDQSKMGYSISSATSAAIYNFSGNNNVDKKEKDKEQVVVQCREDIIECTITTNASFASAATSNPLVFIDDMQKEEICSAQEDDAHDPENTKTRTVAPSILSQLPRDDSNSDHNINNILARLSSSLLEQPSSLLVKNLDLQHILKQQDVMEEESPPKTSPTRRYFTSKINIPASPNNNTSERQQDSSNYKIVIASYIDGTSSYGKYMLNPQAPFLANGDSNPSASYIGIKYHPPEVTRGNCAQLHRKAWLEVSDKYHRYGKNLRFYYKHWISLGHPYNMFFFWLDSKDDAAGRPLPNLPECPRSQLDSDTVLYITDPEVQEKYQLKIVSRGVERFGYVLDANGNPLSTGEEGWIFVLRDGKFYGARKVTETAGLSKKRFHHSSFFAGKAVAAAGIFITTKGEGRIVCMYPHSGHYRPGEAHMQRLLYFVQRLGVDLNTFDVDSQQIAHVARKEITEAKTDEDEPNQKIEKRRKEKKSESLYLTHASHVAWFLRHKAKMLSIGVFGMIQNVRQVRAVSVQEALDAVDNGGYWRHKKLEVSSMLLPFFSE